MKKIAAICGSTRSTSTNLSYIQAIAKLSNTQFEFDIINNLDKLPHFNPDLDNDTPPEAITLFRQRLNAADGILICTPEYAMGVPGTLKNAIDWTVSSMEFSHKATALITASSLGQKSHAALLETLYIIEANIPTSTQLLISNAKTKINPSGEITDTTTLQHIQALIEAFYLNC